MSSVRRRLLVCATIFLLPVVVLAGAWRLGGVSALEDDLIYYLPVRQYIAERIHAGEFPLWNPLVSMGAPIAADPQSGLWYPATYLFLLLPPLVAYPVSLVLHFVLAGGGMYRFLRACRRDWRAALLGAVAFEFCGFLVAHRAHFTIHHAVAWLPWILYGWRRFADTGRAPYAVSAAAAFGLQLLVQHVQVSIVTAVLVTGYVGVVLVRWPWRRAAHLYSGRLWWAYPTAMTVGAALAAIQLLPTWMYYAGSARGSPSYYLFTENSWLPTSAPLMLFPMLQGARTPNLWDQPWWGPSHFCEQSAYASILVLILAAASLRLVRMPSTPEGDETAGQQLARAGQFMTASAGRICRRLLWSGPILEGPSGARLLADGAFRRRLCGSSRQDFGEAWRRLPSGWNREAAFWWGACLLALLIALGDLTPLGKLLFHLPVYRSLRAPARWLLVWSVAMPVMASMTFSTLLKPDWRTARLKSALQFTVMRVLPVAAMVCLLLLFVAARRADQIAMAFPSSRAWPKIAGLMLASRLENAAIWWSLAMMAASGWSLLTWVHTRTRWTLALVFIVFLVDIASVAGFVDVDTRTYSRGDLTNPPPLANAISSLRPGPGDRLLVPRVEANYDRPIEVLCPQYNLRHGIATFNGYGPLWPVGSRMLFRFMPWGSSEEMLALLRNSSLLRAMGVRFVAVRSDEERGLLDVAGQPMAGGASQPKLIRGADGMSPVRYGQDLVWGPLAIPAPGLYELSIDVVPVKGSPSRWFIRLETSEGTEIDRTRTIDPADMAGGRRRIRFLYYFSRPAPFVNIRVKSEMGEAAVVGEAAIRCLGVKADDSVGTIDASRFVKRADLPGGVHLYEAPGARPLVYWAERTTVVPDLMTSIDRLQATVATDGADEDMTVLEWPNGSASVPAARDTQVTVDRLAGHEVKIAASSANGGLLVFNESSDSGWRATVDGRVTPILRVNAVCQGVLVPASGHEVVFRYFPLGLRTGAMVSAAAGLLLMGTLGLHKLLLIWCLRR